MGGVALGGQLTQLENHIVPVRSHEGHAPLDLLLARLGEGRQKLGAEILARVRLAGRGRLVLQRDRAAAGSQLLVRLVGQRLERRDQVQALGEQLGAHPREVLVPHVERGQVHGPAAVPAGKGGGLQERVALLEHPLVVRAHSRHPRRPCRDQLVQEPAPLTGITLDQCQVLGREQHGPYDPQHVPRSDLRRPVDAGAVGLAGVQLQLDQLLPLALPDLRPDDGPLGAHADEGGVGGDAVAAERRQVADRLDQVGLALAVGADEGGDARVQRDLDPGVRAEVGQRKMRDVHGRFADLPLSSDGLWIAGATLWTTSSPLRGRRTGCAARRSSSSAASPPGGRRTARTATR